MREGQEKYIVDPKGRKIAVLLSIRQYREMLEDLHDLATMVERRNEKLITHDEIKKRLKKHGLL